MKGLVTVPSCGLGGQEDPSVLKTDLFAKQIILKFAKVFFLEGIILIAFGSLKVDFFVEGLVLLKSQLCAPG